MRSDFILILSRRPRCARRKPKGSIRKRSLFGLEKLRANLRDSGVACFLQRDVFTLDEKIPQDDFLGRSINIDYYRNLAIFIYNEQFNHVEVWNWALSPLNNPYLHLFR